MWNVVQNAGSRGFAVSVALAAASMLAGIPQTLADPQPIRIGTPLALTGGLAEEGAKQALAYDLWLQRINAQGGIEVDGEMRPVELVSYDYQSDGSRALQLAERLITSDGVDFMTAPFGSGHSKIVATVAERYGVPVVAVASSEPVHDQNFRNLFGTLAPSMGLIESMLTTFQAAHPGLASVAIVGRDDVFPKLMADTLAAAAPEAGIEVVFQELYPVGAIDHSSVVSGIQRANPDWIFVTGYTQDLVLFRRQMHDMNVDAAIVTMITGPAYSEFVENLGVMAENVTSATWWHPSADYEGDDVFGTASEFFDAVAAAGQEADYVHASSAAAMIVLQKAIEAAGSTDRDAVREALWATDIQTFYGPIRFREDGMNSNRELPIIQIQDGDAAVLFPEAMSQSTLRIIE